MESETFYNTVYIIDDHAENLNLLAHILKQSGYKIVAFDNPETALRQIKKNTPDLILLDIMMPKISGFELFERLKEDENTRAIPVIFITARDDTESRIEAFERGAADYIIKPFLNREVQMRVKNQLTSINMRRALENIQKELEQKVESRTYNLKQAQRVANLGSWRLDLSTKMMKWTEQSFEIFGMKNQEELPLSATLEPVVKADLPVLNKAWKTALKKAKREGQNNAFKVQYRINRHGEIRWIEEHGEFFKNKQGNIAYAIGTVQDITSAKRSLELLEKQNKTLRDISWEQSHVVRAPLARLKGLMSLFADKDFEFLSEEKLYEEINKSADEFEQIILDISKKTYIVDEIEKP